MQEIGTYLFHFLSNVVPARTTANVVMFSDAADDSAAVELDLTDPEELSAQLENNVKTYRVVNGTSLSRGLRKAWQASQARRSAAAIVILVAWESDVTGEKPGRLVECVQMYTDAQLHLILVEDTEVEVLSPALADAVMSTGGNIYFLPNQNVFMASKLHGILAGVVKNPLLVENKIAIVHAATFRAIQTDFVDTFAAAGGSSGKMVYFMYCDPIKQVRQRNTNCTASNSELDAFRCVEVLDDKGSLRFWKYSFQYQGGTKFPTCSSVAIVISSSPLKNDFTLRGWLSDHVIRRDQYSIVVYAEVTGSAQQEFRVQARITGPEQYENEMDLRDNGNGDPDVKSGDGIYSRYFTSRSLARGSYVVSISAEKLSNDGNDLFPEGAEDEVPILRKSKTVGLFIVTEPTPDDDILPPNRVVDLKVVSMDHENGTVTLQWTAPGDDYDHGTATTYEIKYSLHSASLSNLYFDSEENAPLKPTGRLVPGVSGTAEKTEFHLPKLYDDASCYIALKAADGNGNSAGVSNVIQIHVERSQTTQDSSTEESTKPSSTVSSLAPEVGNTTTDYLTSTTAQTPTVHPDLHSTSDGNGTTATPVSKQFFDEKMTIVTASAGGILLLILIVNVIVCCCCVKKKKPSPKIVSRKASPRLPYNLNIAYQQDSPPQETENEGTSMSTLADQDRVYTQPHAMNKAARQHYSYHTSKSLLNQEKNQGDSELGFKLVQALPAYATSSLSRYAARLTDAESDTESEKSEVAQPQRPSTGKGTHMYPLGMV